MTDFLTKLETLKEKAKLSDENSDSARLGLAFLLCHHADEIAELVKAAEVMRYDLDERIGDGAKLNPGTMYAFNALSAALAALNKEK